MPQVSISPLEIYKALNKTNCRECGAKTCFAFASMVSQGEKRITDCPYIPEDLAVKFRDNADPQKSFEEEQRETFGTLQEKIAEMDLAEAADILRGTIQNDKLVIKCLGKNFYIDNKGRITSEIHVHSWIIGPLLNYIVTRSKINPCGKWVIFKELPNGERWNPLYMQRCEKALLKIADEHEELFYQVMDLFGKSVRIQGITADRITLLYPLPKVPILICYSGPEDGFDSNLLFYYDEKAEEMVNIESIYSLAVGITMMIEKIAMRHGD